MRGGHLEFAQNGLVSCVEAVSTFFAQEGRGGGAFAR